MKGVPIHVLVVDDNADDRFLTERALRRVLVSGSSVNSVNSGSAAVDYLMGEGEFSDRRAHPFPTLLISDLEMPDGDGFDVLEFMQTNGAWSIVPRIIYSSACRDDDVRTAFQLGVSAYHEKPVTPGEIEDCLRRIVDYWTTCAVPRVDAAGRLIISAVPGTRGSRYAPPECDGIMHRVQSAMSLTHHPA